MNTDSQKEYIFRKLNEFREDPELRSFWPLVDEMLSTIDLPEFDPHEFDKLFAQCLYNNAVHSLATGAFINSAMHTKRKKWYEYED